MFSSGEFQFQFIALLFELIGLSLAFIEVRLPETAARIARYLGQLAEPIEAMRNRSANKSKQENKLSISLGKLLNTVLTIGTLPLIFIFVIKTIGVAWDGTFSVAWLIPQLIGFLFQLLIVILGLLILVVVLYFTVAAGSDFATRFVEGRALGTLGIMLAAIGLLMEFYQLIDIL